MGRFDPKEILRKPYMRAVVPDGDSFFAEIVEFQGCFASADTPAEALSLLEEVAEDWLRAADAMGQEIPEPMEAGEFSGKFLVRMPKSLHRRASLLAAKEGVSLNQVMVASIAEKVGHEAARRPQVRSTAVYTINLNQPGGRLCSETVTFRGQAASTSQIQTGIVVPFTPDRTVN